MIRLRIYERNARQSLVILEFRIDIQALDIACLLRAAKHQNAAADIRPANEADGFAVKIRYHAGKTESVEIIERFFRSGGVALSGFRRPG